MKLLLLFFVVSAILQTLESYDLEIEGTITLDKKFMTELKNLKDTIHSISEHKADTNKQTRMRRTLKFNKNTQNQNNTQDQNNRQDQNNTQAQNNTQPQNNSTKSVRDYFNDFASNLTSIGLSNIQNITKYIRHRCGLTTDLRTITKPVSEDFEAIIKEKVKNLIKKKFRQPTLCEYELEYMLLNIAEICSTLLHRKLQVILDKMLQATNKTSLELDTEELSKRIHTRYISYKKQSIRMMCYKFHVCRQFPAFSEHLGELISEILKLPKTKLLSFLKILNTLLLRKLTFIVGMLEPDVFSGIVNKLKESDDVSKIRQSLTIMRSVIAARYKLLYSTHATKLELVKKTKAVRVLLDIFDKTFEVDGEGLTDMTFDTVISDIREWAIDKRKNEDLSKTLDSLIQYILTTIKHVWKDGVVTEINALIEIILLGRTADEFTETFLLSKGSHFVQNAIISGEINVF